MEKYYWAPTREDRIGVCMGIFQVRTPLLSSSLPCSTVCLCTSSRLGPLHC